MAGIDGFSEPSPTQEHHTPGEWFWALDKHNQRTSLMRSGSGDYVISPQADVGDYGLSVNPWNDVSDADAALIQAAPDLLEALRCCLIKLERYRQYHPETWVGGVEAEYQAAATTARAAIAKATDQ